MHIFLLKISLQYWNTYYKYRNIPACSDRLWKYDPSCIHSLEDPFPIHSPRDLSYEDGGHPLWSKLFVDAQEIDFYDLSLSESGGETKERIR